MVWLARHAKPLDQKIKLAYILELHRSRPWGGGALNFDKIHGVEVESCKWEIGGNGDQAGPAGYNKHARKSGTQPQKKPPRGLSGVDGKSTVPGL